MGVKGGGVRMRGEGEGNSLPRGQHKNEPTTLSVWS